MKFLLDAQLPLALKSWLKSQGHDVVHTLDLPQKI
jgi:predicted nuclease of predicted toxin-antitoxin system